MRAPSFISPPTPVEAYKVRYWGPGQAPLGNTIGRALAIGGAALDDIAATRAAVMATTDDTAGRARALRDRAALASVVDTHAGLSGGDAVAAQPQAIDELARIQADGQGTLGSPGMVAAYDQQMGPAIADATGQIAGHTLRQAVAERQAVSDKELHLAQQNAAGAWQDPARLVAGLDTVKAIAADQAGDAASPDDRAAAVRSAVGGAVADAVGQAFAAGEPEFAAHIMSGWGDTLSPAAYQTAVAKLDRANGAQRISAVFGQAAGGNPQAGAGDASAALSPGVIALDAPAGAAVHPLADGTVRAVTGTPDNATIEIVHPDGSSTAYGGLGTAAVNPGDLVTPAHAIGSASPLVTVAAQTPVGDAIDAGAMVRNAGGAGAVIGRADTPRSWDMQDMLDRIAQRRDLTSDEQALAMAQAQRRMSADQAQQTADDASAGRSVVSLFAADPGGVTRAADLPSDVARQLSPAALARIDTALRNAAQSMTPPAPDNADALRAELEQRQFPDGFTQRNLASSIGDIHPGDLARLAAGQNAIAAGTPDSGSQTARSAILDAIARHEFVNSVTLPGDVLPQVHSATATMMRLNQTDPGDQAEVDNTVLDAIQSQTAQP